MATGRHFAHSALNIQPGRLFLAVACTVLVVLSSISSLAQTQAKPKVVEIANPSSVLLVGNSFFYFNNGMNAYVDRLAKSADAKSNFRASMATINGAALDWHDIDSYFRPSVASFTQPSDTDIVYDRREPKFDTVILMDCSLCAIHPDLKATFPEHVKQQSAKVRAHGAVPVLFMTWAYGSAPAMTAPVAEAYTQAGNSNDVLVIPVGLAFANSVAQRPDVDLYFVDKQHPSRMGTYLAACTVYASLFKKSPVGLKYTAGLDEGTANFLQTVAWETVQKYFKPE